MNFSGKTIALAVTGGIAAYKACDLVRELYRRGADRVLVILTKTAEAFVSPLTLQALSRYPVYSDPLAVDSNGVPLHIVLAQQADALVILPATADALAKLAHGLADDLVTTTAITFTGKPVLVAPAMNTRMWQHPLTQANLKRLAEVANYTLIEPTSGSLACGEVGEGHLAEMETILQYVYRSVHPQAAWFQGVRALVTAGGTSEPIDPVRVISNHSSGKMGVALADELWAVGAEVCLVTSRPPHGRQYECVPVDTAQSMQEAVLSVANQQDLIIMAAAVSDYRPVQMATQKLKRESQPDFTLALTANSDILATLGAQKPAGQVLVGFAAESENLLQNAEAKLRRKNLDAIVANDISQPHIGFNADENEVTLILANGAAPLTIPRSPKTQVAREILRQLSPLLKASPTGSKNGRAGQ